MLFNNNFPAVVMFQHLVESGVVNTDLGVLTYFCLLLLIVSASFLNWGTSQLWGENTHFKLPEVVAKLQQIPGQIPRHSLLPM